MSTRLPGHDHFVKHAESGNLDFGYFVLIWWQSDKKQEIPKDRVKDLFIWTELLIV